MKKWRYLFGSLTAALALAGCTLGEPCGTAEEKTAFRKAAARLDSDGSEYFILNGAAAAKVFDRSIERTEISLWQNENIPAAKKNDIQKSLTALRMAAALAGIGHIQCAGYSARTLAAPAFGRSFINSKLFLALPPEAPGVLNNLFLREKEFSCREVLAELPADVRFFAAVNLAPEALLQALKFAGTWGENSALSLMEKLPLQEIAGDLRGYWSWAVANDEKSSFMLVFPDNSGKLRRVIESEPGMIFPGAEIEFPEKTVKVFSSVQAKRYFSGTAPKMRERSDFNTLLRALPERGFFCCFQNENFSIGRDLLEIPLPESGENVPALMAAAHLDDGIIFSANSASGPLDFCLRVGDLLMPEYINSEKSPDAPAETACQCEKLLSALAEKRQLSEKSAVAGLQECFNGKIPAEFLMEGKKVPEKTGDLRIIYFGKNSEPGIPLAISSPLVHQDKFHVLFNDMSVQTFKLERADSCRRMIGFLHTVKRYDESTLHRLMVMAQKFDAELSKL